MGVEMDATTTPHHADLYLDLLKKVVTGNIYGSEPSHEGDTMKSVGAVFRHYFEKPAIALVPLRRLDNVQRCIMDVLARGIPGDLVEAGVWRGGTSIFMRAVLEAMSDQQRRLWVADSFEGLPTTKSELEPKEARVMEGPMFTRGFKQFAASLDEVRSNFERYGLLDARTTFLKGWFKDTLHTIASDRFAVIRIDADLYSSTRDCLRALYPKLSVGGYVIIDDYGLDSWTDCRRAVDEYRSEQGIADEIVPVDSQCVYWKASK
jgi:Macrocin-O-methyltransferase (TylF)